MRWLQMNIGRFSYVRRQIKAENSAQIPERNSEHLISRTGF